MSDPELIAWAREEVALTDMYPGEFTDEIALLTWFAWTIVAENLAAQ